MGSLAPSPVAPHPCCRSRFRGPVRPRGLNGRPPCPPWPAPGLPTAPDSRAIPDTRRPSPTRPGAGKRVLRQAIAHGIPALRSSCGGKLHNVGIMREPAGGVAIQALCGPRIIHAMQNAALIVTRAVSVWCRAVISSKKDMGKKHGYMS